MRKYWGERVTAALCICLSFYFGWLALEFPAGGGTFPLFATGGTIFLSLIMLANSFFQQEAEIPGKDGIRLQL